MAIAHSPRPVTSPASTTFVSRPTMQAPPLPVHLINMTLQYLLPPTAPMPIHLICRELLQRHHFLNITPDDPAAYFCWPSFCTSSTASVIQDLDMRAGNEALLNKEVHDITYEHDEDGPRARVRLADDLDLYVLFAWQGSGDPGSLGDDGWRYYDTKRIPAVGGHRSQPPVPNQEVGSFHTHVNDYDGPHDFGPANGGEAGSRPSSPCSDAYWDNYCAASSSSNSPSQGIHALPNKDDKCDATDDEATYWAAYSAVQGSADSTIPSRVPSSRKLNALRWASLGDDDDNYPYQCNNSYGGYNEDRNCYDEPLTIQQVRSRRDDSCPEELNPAPSTAVTHELIGSGHSRGEHERILGRFSPEVEDREKERERKLSEERDASDAIALARALFPVMSYREYLENLEEHKSQPPDPSLASGVEFIRIPGLDDATTGLHHSSNSPKGVDTNDTVSSEQLSRSNSTAVTSEPETKLHSAADGAVAEAVRGVYRLWLSKNQSTTDTTAVVRSNEEAFLALVESAISSA